MKARKLITTAALALLVLGIAVPAAIAGPPDALARYVASQKTSDVVGRWLAAHPSTTATQPGPISDVASSLEVARHLSTVQPAPLSDLESTLQVDRLAVESQPAPISDISSSLQVARDQAALESATTKSGNGFMWRDAGLGAGAMLLLVTLTFAATFVRRHRHVTA
jgi:hypothetical protein